MAKLNEARRVAIAEIDRSSALIPLSQFGAALTVIADRITSIHEVQSRFDSTKKEISIRSTSRLRSYRMCAAAFAAIAAGGALFGKEVVNEFFPHETQLPNQVTSKRVASSITHPVTEEEYLEIEAKARIEKDAFNRKALMAMAIMVGAFSGAVAWQFSNQIQRIESSLQQLDEETGTKTLLCAYLKRVFQRAVPRHWTLEHLVDTIDLWSKGNDHGAWLARQVGNLGFAQLLVAKGEKLGLLKVTESTEDGSFIETYSIRSGDQT